ncbi:CRISPR-associated endoribonuclease Cas6 [Thermococci archaeon]|nr:MAG: CRISPR-associated endoribonuclease Cas6 [Thermococci archaeon]
MRVKLSLISDSPFCISFNYNHSLQGFIYKALKLGDEEVANRVHNNKKDIKFVFSKPFAHGKKGRDWITDKKKGVFVKSRKFYFLFSTAEPWIFNTFLEGLFKLESITLFGTTFYLEPPKVLKEPNSLSGKPLKVLSPINVFTNNAPNGAKTWDLSPFQPRQSPFENEPMLWKKLILQNLCSKYLFLKGEFYTGELDIKVLDKPDPKSKRFWVKPINGDWIYVRAWELGIMLYGDEEILKITYELGLGMRNSLGFGMLGVM